MHRSIRVAGVLGTLLFSLGLAGSAQAVSISLNWVSVNGVAGATDVATLNVSETAILEMRVNAMGESLSFAGIDVVFDAAMAEVDSTADIDICSINPLATGNSSFFGTQFCGGGALAEGPTPGILDQDGLVFNPNALSATGPFTSENTFTLALITFHAEAAGSSEVNVNNNGIFSSINLADGTVIVDGIEGPGVILNVNVVPEPGTLLLTAAGLGLLAVVGGRRS